jgi:uncharacterized membrane protein
MALEVVVGFFEMVLGAFGALFIVYGAVIAIIDLLAQEARIRVKGYPEIRKTFTTRILIGLEFFVAADVIKTILDPTFHDLIVLGSIVAIRTVFELLPRERGERALGGSGVVNVVGYPLFRLRNTFSRSCAFLMTHFEFSKVIAPSTSSYGSHW